MRATSLLERSPAQEAGRELARSLAPMTDESESQNWRENWALLAQAHVFARLMPIGAWDPADVVGWLEGLGEGCRDAGVLLAVGAHCLGAGAPLRIHGGSPHRPVVDAMRTGSMVAAFAGTEPDSGSDVMSLVTSYEEHDGAYTLNGVKSSVTNAAEADVFVVLATRDTRLHSRGVSAFLVPADTRGVSIQLDSPLPGLRGCSIGSVLLDGVVVPRSALLGRRDTGARVFRDAMLWERSLIMAAHVGVLRRHVETCLARAQSRRQFQRPIGANQYVAGRVVDLLSRYVIARLLVGDTATKLAHGTLTDAQAALTKLWVSEAAVASAVDAVRIRGAADYLAEVSSSREVTDALAGLIYSGTSDIQRVIVAAELGLRS